MYIGSYAYNVIEGIERFFPKFVESFHPLKENVIYGIKEIFGSSGSQFQASGSKGEGGGKKVPFEHAKNFPPKECD